MPKILRARKERLLILTAFGKICRPTSPRWIEMDIYTSWSKTTVEKRGTGRNTGGKGWRTGGGRDGGVRNG